MSEIRVKVIVKQIAREIELSLFPHKLASQIVKEALERLDNPPNKISKLFLNGIKLNQEHTLQQLGIQQNSLIEVQFSYKTKVSAHHDFFGVLANSEIDLWETPKKLQDRILRKNLVDKYGYTILLQLNNNPLQDNLTFFQQGVEDQSQIQYTVNAKLIIINQANENRFEIDFEVTKSINDLQNLIKSKFNIVGNFELECEGKQLNEFQTNFFSLQIKNNSQIHIKISKSWKIKIRKEEFMEPIEKTFTVNPETQVIVLEQFVKETFYIEPSVKLNLMFEDQKLDSQKKVSECNLYSGCYLTIVYDSACPTKIEIIMIDNSDHTIQQIVKIDITQYVNCLDNNFPQEQVKYIFNGQTLEKNKTFQEQQIEDRCQIYYEIVAAYDLILMFINTATDDKQELTIKSNERISDRIQKLLKYDKKMPASYYCVVHKGRSIDNPDSTFGELNDIESKQIITYCSQKLQITIIYKDKEQQLEVERELTVIELGYFVKKELNIENDIDILQGGQKIALNQKIKTKEKKYEVIEKPQQLIQQGQNAQMVQQQAQINMQAIFGNGNPFIPVPQPPSQPAPPPPYKRQELEIQIIVNPIEITVDMKVEGTMSVREMLNELRVNQQLPLNQPLYCEIGGAGADENLLLSSFQDLGYIIVEIQQEITVQLQNIKGKTKENILLEFDKPLIEKAKQLQIDHQKFTWKNQVIDIKKSCQELGIFNMDVISYEPQSSSSIKVVKVIIEYEDMQPLKVNILPSKTIEQLRKENDLNDVQKQLYIKSTDQQAQDYQKISDLANQGELFLVYKSKNQKGNSSSIKVVQVIIEYEDMQSLKVNILPSKTIEQLRKENNLNDVEKQLYIKSTNQQAQDYQKISDLANQKELFLVYKAKPAENKDVKQQQSAEMNQQKKDGLQQLNQSFENKIYQPPNSDPQDPDNLKPQDDQQSKGQHIEPAKKEEPQHFEAIPNPLGIYPPINITLVLNKENIILANLDQSKSVENLKQLIFNQYKEKLIKDHAKVQQTTDFELCSENKYLPNYNLLHVHDLANKELKIFSIITVRVISPDKKTEWGKKLFLRQSWKDLKNRMVDPKLPLEKIQLNYNNEIQKDEKTLAECNVMDQDKIDLVLL